MNITYEAVQSLLREASKADDSFAMLRMFIGMTGDHVAALVLNQAVYWSGKTDDQDGWFYKTAQDWNTEIGVSYFQLKRATTNLEKIGFNTKKKHVNKVPVLHYRIDSDSLYSAIVNYLQSEDALNLRNLKMRDSSKNEGFIPQIEVSSNWGNLDSNLKKLKVPIKEKTKNTTENTTALSANALGDPSAKEWKKDIFVENFKAKFFEHYGAKYQDKTGDYVHLAKLRKVQGELLTESAWNVAVQNYLKSPQRVHTLADLCVNYPTFHRSALDRFGQPTVMARKPREAVIPG